MKRFWLWKSLILFLALDIMLVRKFHGRCISFVFFHIPILSSSWALRCFLDLSLKVSVFFGLLWRKLLSLIIALDFWQSERTKKFLVLKHFKKLNPFFSRTTGLFHSNKGSITKRLVFRSIGLRNNQLNKYNGIWIVKKSQRRLYDLLISNIKFVFLQD